MTTIEMLNSIAGNNFKNPKSADWKAAEIPANANFCLHLEKAWINFMKGMVYGDSKYFEMTEERLAAALSSLNLIATDPMVERLKTLCQIKTVKGKVRYTSKITFRKNALMYLYDCVNGESLLEPDEKLEKALGINGCSVRQMTPEEKRAREIKKMMALAASLSNDEKNILMEAMKKAA